MRRYLEQLPEDLPTGGASEPETLEMGLLQRSLERLLEAREALQPRPGAPPRWIEKVLVESIRLEGREVVARGSVWWLTPSDAPRPAADDSFVLELDPAHVWRRIMKYSLLVTPASEPQPA